MRFGIKALAMVIGYGPIHAPCFEKKWQDQLTLPKNVDESTANMAQQNDMHAANQQSPKRL